MPRMRKRSSNNSQHRPRPPMPTLRGHTGRGERITPGEFQDMIIEWAKNKKKNVKLSKSKSHLS